MRLYVSLLLLLVCNWYLTHHLLFYCFLQSVTYYTSLIVPDHIMEEPLIYLIGQGFSMYFLSRRSLAVLALGALCRGLATRSCDLRIAASTSFSKDRNLLYKSFFGTKISTRAISSSDTPAVKTITAKRFGDILQGEARHRYQIIDVREPDELQLASLNGSDIINLPLKSLNVWSGRIVSGELLDRSKPTVCMCHHGGRSLTVANYLVQNAGFGDVYSVEGGIHKVSEDVDPSIPLY
jgi:rhodanese-related sulfurtransferase